MKILINIFLFTLLSLNIYANDRVAIKAIAIPLADHYAGIIAYEKYRDKMQYAKYELMLLKAPALVRAYFYSQDDADIAFNVSPMVMDMFAQKPNFRWVSLIHRDGNALVINDIMNKEVKLGDDKTKRKPDSKIADSLSKFKKINGEAVECAIPSMLATHTTILYKYLKEHNKTMSLSKYDNPDLLLKIVKPPKSPVYLKKQTLRGEAAAFEQSMPWPEIANGDKKGYIAWYSKDVMKTKNGHVECIIIAKDATIKNKYKALKEVIYYIHKAGIDIEKARVHGGKELDKIIKMIRKHIPSHTKEAIVESLRSDIMAINYKHLNVDKNSKESFKEIMDLAYEAGFIKTKIDIESLADERFSTSITNE